MPFELHRPKMSSESRSGSMISVVSDCRHAVDGDCRHAGNSNSLKAPTTGDGHRLAACAVRAASASAIGVQPHTGSRNPAGRASNPRGSQMALNDGRASTANSSASIFTTSIIGPASTATDTDDRTVTVSVRECLPPTTRRFLTGTGSRSSPMARHMTGSAGNPVRLHLYGSGCVSTTRYLVSNFL